MTELSEPTRNRRDFLRKSATFAGVAAIAAGCSKKSDGDSLSLNFSDGEGNQNAETDKQQSGSNASSDLPEVNWQMATSWPLGLGTIFGAAQLFTERVSALSQGRFTITPQPAGTEIDGNTIGGLEVLPAVSEGKVPIGHSAAYYYLDATNALAFGTAMPFGLTDRQQNAWLYENGGLELLQEVHAEKFNVIQFPCGSTGTQMGGWFNRRINSTNDLTGLKMRLPGLGGEILNRLGGEAVSLAGGDIYEALKDSTIDAAEFIGPADDFKLNLQEVSSFYYYPGWWEPTATLDIQISLEEWNNLPEVYQEVIRSAARETNLINTASYDTRNTEFLPLIQESGVELVPFPEDVLKRCEEVAFELYQEFASEDESFKTIFDSWSKFRSDIQTWHGLAEASYLDYVGKSTAASAN